MLQKASWCTITRNNVQILERLNIGNIIIIGASLSEPHTSKMSGVIDHAQKTMTKIG